MLDKYREMLGAGPVPEPKKVEGSIGAGPAPESKKAKGIAGAGYISDPYARNIITPANKQASQALLNWLNSRGLLGTQYRVGQSLVPGQRELINLERGYWENPYRIARYHNYIQAQGPEWKPPEWLDIPTIEASYKLLERRNEGKPWYKWKYLNEQDEGTSFLRNLPSPPIDFLFPAEIAEIEAGRKERQAEEIGSWKQLEESTPLFGIEGLPAWRQVALTVLTPQPLTEVDETGRPIASKATANIIRGAMSGLAGAGLVKYGAAALSLLTGTAAAPAVGTIALIGGTTFALAAIYQNMTGKKVPVLGDLITQSGIVFNIFAEAFERTFGMGEMIVNADDEELQEILENIGPSWQAASLTWETSQRNVILNTLARLSGEEIPKVGEEVWMLEKGLVEPQKVSAGRLGVEGLDSARQMLIDGADPDEVYQEFIADLGEQALLSDFVWQSIADPLNLAPTGWNTAMYRKGVKTGDVLMQTAWKPPTIGQVIQDAMPFPMNLVTSALGARGSVGLLDGMTKYQTFIRTGFMPGVNADANYKPPADYSNLQKTLGNLDELGIPKEFAKPTEKTSKTYFKWLGELTPESKARYFQANFIDQLQTMLEAARTDPAEMIRITKMTANADPHLTGEALDAILRPANEAPYQIKASTFNSPIGVAFAVAMKDLVESGKLDELYLSQWEAGKPALTKLQQVASLLEMTPENVIVKLNEDFDLATALRKAGGEAGIDDFANIDNATLKKAFGVFMGKNPLPTNPDFFRMKLVNMVEDATQDYLIKRFGIKPDPKLTKFFSMMKNIQNLLVLGLNPAYAINNKINNVITRAVDGVVGFQSKQQINDFLTRMKIDPARPDSGLHGEWSAAFREYGIKEDGTADKISQIKHGEKDLLNAANQKVSGLKNRVALVGKVAAAIERSDSRQAYVSALRMAMNSMWQTGAGIPKMTPNLEMQLDKVQEGLSRKFYDAVRDCYNTDEFDAALYKMGETIPIDPIIDRVAEAIAQGHHNIVKDPSGYKELLYSTGIADELRAGLQKATTKAQVNQVFNSVIERSATNIRNKMSADLVARAVEVKNLLETGSIDEAILLRTDMIEAYKMEWLHHFDEYYEIYNHAGQMSPAERNALHRSQEALDDMRFKGLDAWEESTYKGIFDALGKSDDPAVIEFLATYKDLRGGWRDFFRIRSEKYQKVFAPDYKTDDWVRDYEAVRAEVAQMATEMQIREDNLLTRADELYIDIIEGLGGDKYQASVARAAARVIRNEMLDLLNSHRRDMIENPPADITERRARENQFYQEVYKPKIRELKAVEKTGAQQLSDMKEVMPANRAMFELMHEDVYPYLEAVRNEYLAEMDTPKLRFDDIPDHLKPEIAEWVSKVKVDLPATKLTAMKYAEAKRDFALLNYQMQTNFDTALSAIFPYQFWYTRTMMNWGSRMIDQPAMFAMYARYEEMRRKLENANVPSRLRNKMRFPVAWMPEWTGGGLWIDPLKQLFPFAQFQDPAQWLSYQENSAKYAANEVLDQMVKDGLITEAEAEVAKETHEGPHWKQAFAAGAKQADLNNPMTLASMFVQPAMYITTPFNLLRGTPEKISPTPILRYSSALQSALKDTPAEAMGEALGLLGTPERLLRGKVMTPAKAAMGEWGDYYVDKTLVNMVAMGEISLRDSQIAMQEREGQVYEMALERTKEELSYRVPGILPILALKGGANIPQVASSIFLGMFPSGLLPEGELKMKNLSDEHTVAWERAKLGDKEALSNFYDEHPEMAARIALHDEPEERTRQFLISEIWDSYYALPQRNRSEVVKQMGPGFKEHFIDSDTRNYEGLSMEQLAEWAYQLGGYIPRTPYTQGVKPQEMNFDLWPDEVAREYEKFTEERNKLFPGYYLLQNEYYNLPYNKRRQFLSKYPELKQVWDWSHEYARQHPIIAPILAENKLEGGMEQEARGTVNINGLDPDLTQSIMLSNAMGLDLSPGAWMSLNYQWEKLGKPYGDFAKWVDEEVLAQFK